MRWLKRCYIHLKNDALQTKECSSLQLQQKIRMDFYILHIIVRVCTLCNFSSKSESAYTNMSEVLIVCVLQTLVTHITTRLEQRFSSIDPEFVTRLLPPAEKVSQKKPYL